MDEELIKEVEQHAVIYNRQKYFLNSVGPSQYETKDEAWNAIAHRLNSDVETCKKRWKYLRERYVQQLKQGVPPTYEHLSRPYLEKMKFLDQHIQPRKSYRNVSNFLPSPNATFGEYMDSKSNGSMKTSSYPHYPENFVSIIKTEPSTFLPFNTTSTSSPNRQHHDLPNQLPVASTAVVHHQQTKHSEANVTDARENDAMNIPSSSSSLKSPLSSPQAVDHHETNDNMKRARLAYNANNNVPHQNHDPEDSSDNDDQAPLSMQQRQEHIMNEAARRRNCRTEPSQHEPNNEFLYSFYQRFAQPNQMRCSEQLLGELVTSELLKMNKERRKVAQRRILEVLFFDD